jgi:hypothetical protein
MPPVFIFTALSYRLTQVFQTKSLGSSPKHCLLLKYLGSWACQRSPVLVHPLSEYHAYIRTIHPTSSKGWVEFPAGYVVSFFKSEMLNKFSFMMKFVPFWLDDMWSPVSYDGFSNSCGKLEVGKDITISWKVDLWRLHSSSFSLCFYFF